MEAKVINTDIHTFLIKFQFQSTNSRFIVQGSGLMEVLKKYDLNGVEYIKIFDPVKYTFKRVSKETILSLFSWETEVYLYLKDHYYFK
jgi:hypothetical protein